MKITFSGKIASLTVASGRISIVATNADGAAFRFSAPNGAKSGFMQQDDLVEVIKDEGMVMWTPTRTFGDIKEGIAVKLVMIGPAVPVTVLPPVVDGPAAGSPDPACVSDPID